MPPLGDWRAEIAAEIETAETDLAELQERLEAATAKASTAKAEASAAAQQVARLTDPAKPLASRAVALNALADAAGSERVRCQAAVKHKLADIADLRRALQQLDLLNAAQEAAQ